MHAERGVEACKLALAASPRPGDRGAWEASLRAYPDGFYADLAKVQLKKIAAEEARVAAAEKAKLAEQEKARLAAEGARQAEIAKAAAISKAAEEARAAGMAIGMRPRNTRSTSSISTLARRLTPKHRALMHSTW
jgi:hypothetical protein